MRSKTVAENLDQVSPAADAVRFQQRLLPMVSRTFALTIPQLPGALSSVVANAYLWCRIADTVEDEPSLDALSKQALHESLVGVIDGSVDAQAWAQRTSALLSEATSSAERELVAGTDLVAALTSTFSARQVGAIRMCVKKMCRGMTYFELQDGRRGLETAADLDYYCYSVAGVVGEMLTTLFCDYSPDIAARRKEMTQLAASFGQGLQMTNILKDIWEDLDAGRCWLPREVFSQSGYNLNDLSPTVNRDAFNSAMREMVGIAHGHLRNALNYALFIPKYESGIRRFCLWSLGLSVLTLQRITRSSDFASAAEVKVSRFAVGATVASTNLMAHHNLPVRVMFELVAHRLPLKPAPIGYTAELLDSVSAPA
jgi:farnesyl-diphosphate farnesyltransferase